MTVPSLFLAVGGLAAVWLLILLTLEGAFLAGCVDVAVAVCVCVVVAVRVVVATESDSNVSL